MKNYFITLLLLCAVVSNGQKTDNKSNSKSKATKLEKKQTSLVLLGETMDLPSLESVIYDKKRNLLYVSIQAAAVPGDGSIATVSLDGKIQNLKFTSGLNDPKGMAIVGNKLYVGDLLELVEIDLETGKVVNKYTGPKVRYFNDVTSDSQGNVYVTDMHASSIYKLDKNKNFTEWYDSPKIESANGILAVGKELIIGGWGYFTDGKALNAGIGKLHKMDITTQKLSDITPNPLGNLDGLQVLDNSSYFVTDWKEGKVFKVYKDGTSEELLDTERGAADLWYIKEKKLLLLPLNKQNKLAFYQVK